MKTLRRRNYPLLKLLVPLALLVFAFGIFMFFTQPDASPDRPGVPGEPGVQLSPAVLVPYILVAAVLAFGGLLWRKEEEVTLVFPSDQLQGKNRSDLQKVLDGLDESLAKGEITKERYDNARARVLKAMK